MTPMKAIRAKCLECSNGQPKEVRLCPCKDCALYPYRMGHRPKSDEEPDEAAFEEKNEDSPIVLRRESASGGDE